VYRSFRETKEKTISFCYSIEYHQTFKCDSGLLFRGSGRIGRTRSTITISISFLIIYTVQTNIYDFLKNQKKVEQRFHVEDGFVCHPLIKKDLMLAKDFQINIASNAVESSTLVVLPTGMGKTIIAILVAAEKISEDDGKILMVSPTRPLTEQHHDSFERFLNIEGMIMFSGSMKPEKRVEEWKKARIVFSTPQTINNDLQKERYDLSGVSLLIVDEAHRSVGDYAYTGILSNYHGHVLALTASPGGDSRKIMEVIENLGVDNIEVRTSDAEDVRGHIKGINIEWRRTELPVSMKAIKDLVNDYLQERVRKLRKLGFLRDSRPGMVSKKKLLKTRDEILKKYIRNKGLMFGSLHNQAQAVQADHMLELLETQGVIQCRMYIDRMRKKMKKTKAEKGFLKDPRIMDSINRLEKYIGPSHPKLDLLEDIVRSSVEKGETMIIFTQIRDTIPLIMDRLEGIRIERFVGQSKGKDGRGLKQKEQKEILDRFRKREFDVLIATSVAEEGIDIPDVDLVLFYEPIPSEIRTIQRRGRTGRSSTGKVIILITSGTRDEAYYWAEGSRERKMGRIMSWLSHESVDQEGDDYDE